MAQKPSGVKSERILEIYVELQRGTILKKADLAQRFGVNPRSIQRDIDDLRSFLSERGIEQKVVYDRVKGGYYLIDDRSSKLSNEETLATIKILLESRSLTKEEMFPILDKLLLNCVPKDRVPAVQKLIANEQLYYIEPHHHKRILSTLWSLGEAVRSKRRIGIRYKRLKDKGPVSRVVEPVGIMFSEYYFYLIAYIANADIRNKLKEKHKERYPAIYRVDRITSVKSLDEHFYVPYQDRFQEGEFRKRVQFMYGGELRTVKFRYTGQSIEAVLDRLPTAEILSRDEDGWVVSAEVYGDGIDMWINGQRGCIQTLELTE